VVPFFGLSVGIPALKKWGGYPIFRSILRRVLDPLFGPFFDPQKEGSKRGPKRGSFLGPMFGGQERIWTPSTKFQGEFCGWGPGYYWP
jgi:hypothetical protein